SDLPFIVTRQQVPGVARAKRSAVRLNDECCHKMTGRLTNERGAVPVFARVATGGVERMTSAGSEMAVPIDLADLVGDRLNGCVAGDAGQHAGGPTAHGFVIAVRNRQVYARVAVGRGAEENAFLAEAYSPGVVVGVAQKLHFRAVRLEAIEALT